MSFTIKELLLFQITLFAIFSPFACIGPFSVLTEGYSNKIKYKISARVSIYSSAVLIIVAWAGEIVLRILGISIEALAAAGGLVLILSSIPMIMKGESPRRKVKATGGIEADEDSDESWRSIVVSPLVFPLTIGAGSMSIVVTQVGYVAGIEDRLAITCCLIIHGLLILGTYIFSAHFAGKLGKGSTTVTRVGGIILLSVAFIIFTNGLKVLLPGLA